MPGSFLGDPFHKYVGFLFYQFRDALAEFTADVVERDIGIFDRIVQCGCRQEFLVAGHGGGNRDCLHRVDDVREVLAPAFYALVRLYGKDDCLVK